MELGLMKIGRREREKVARQHKRENRVSGYTESGGEFNEELTKEYGTYEH